MCRHSTDRITHTFRHTNNVLAMCCLRCLRCFVAKNRGCCAAISKAKQTRLRDAQRTTTHVCRSGWSRSEYTRCPSNRCFYRLRCTCIRVLCSCSVAVGPTNTYAHTANMFVVVLAVIITCRLLANASRILRARRFDGVGEQST